MLTRADAARGTVADDPYVRALSEIVLREAPFRGSGTGDADADWRTEITDDIVRYWDAHTIEDYLRLRADELRGSPQLGWEPIAAPAPANTLTPAPVTAPRPSPAVTLAQTSEVRDAFLSHAGEDEAVAAALADALQARGHTVWYDEAELVVGDSLSEHIDLALARARFGVVILSPAFLAKHWPRRELEGLIAREMADGHRVILPVWHELDHHDLIKVSPPLADRRAANTADGVDHVADAISRAIHRRGPGPVITAAGDPG